MSHERLEHVPVASIGVARQVRDGVGDEEAMCGLMASMESVGLQQPIRVKGAEGAIVVVDGHRRLEAARRLGWDTIAAIREASELDAAGTLLRQLVANVQRLDLTDSERGRAFLQLMSESGWTAAETSRRTGVSQSMISRLTAIVTDPEVAGLVSEGRLPGSTGYALVRVRDSNERSRLIKEALEGRLTRDGVVAQAKSLNKVKRERRGPSGPCGRVVLRMEGRRTVTVVGPGLTVPALLNWLGELFSQLSGLSSTGELSLAEVASSISGRK